MRGFDIILVSFGGWRSQANSGPVVTLHRHLLLRIGALEQDAPPKG
jgi:hypothetical protein